MPTSNGARLSDHENANSSPSSIQDFFFFFFSFFLFFFSLARVGCNFYLPPSDSSAGQYMAFGIRSRAGIFNEGKRGKDENDSRDEDETAAEGTAIAPSFLRSESGWTTEEGLVDLSSYSARTAEYTR